MITMMKSFVFVGVLILCIHFYCYQVSGNTVKPTFPSVFQVEAQGIFKNVKNKFEFSLYYDRKNNRGAMRVTNLGSTQLFIYRFDDDELLQITGTSCSVDQISSGSVKAYFFPFLVDRSSNKVLANPEELLFFTNSVFEREDSNFPLYYYKAKFDSPLFHGSNCEVNHTFTKPEEKASGCDNNICEPTIASINVVCPNNDGTEKVNIKYDFFRFQSDIIDANVFLPPPGVFCNVKNKIRFPGLPGYFSFSYDLTDDQKRESYYPGGQAVHKKVWYDSKMNVLRMDEFDTEGLLLASRIFDVNGGIAYTSIASLSTCEMGTINSRIVPLDEMTKLPKVFFLGENALNRAVYVGTRRIQELDYEIWSLMSNNEQKTKEFVQNFYFTKSGSKAGISEILKLSHAEIYTYQINNGVMSEQPVVQNLPVNNFLDRLRWEAFDVSACFTKDQKKGFRLKVDGPPTMKDSKTFQEVLNQLYMNLIGATNISAIRLNDLACVFDGVKIVEFTGQILDKPKIFSSDGRKNELDMNEAYRVIQYLAKSGKLSLNLQKDGQGIEYKITEIEDIKKEEEEDKNLYSGGVVAACVFGITPLVMFVSAYISIKIHQKRQGETDSEQRVTDETGDYSVQFTPMKS